MVELSFSYTHQFEVPVREHEYVLSGLKHGNVIPCIIQQYMYPV